MTKKLPSGHNIGGTTKQKRRKEHKKNLTKTNDRMTTQSSFEL